MTDNKPETSVTFSWTATLRDLAFSLLAAVLGVVMFQADEALVWLIGALAFVAGAGMFVVLLFTGGTHSAPCPVCGAPIDVLMKSGTYLKCTKCSEYFEADDGKLRQMDEAHVAAEPRFEVRLPWWDDLSAPMASTITIGGPRDYVTDRLQEAILTRKVPDRTVSAAWPTACCICGSIPTRYESLAQEVTVGPEGIGGVRDRKLIVKVEGIPHCDQHEKGAKLAESVGQFGRVLFFRSYSYRNEFRRANPWKITWD